MFFFDRNGEYYDLIILIDSPDVEGLYESAFGPDARAHVYNINFTHTSFALGPNFLGVDNLGGIQEIFFQGAAGSPKLEIIDPNAFASKRTVDQ